MHDNGISGVALINYNGSSSLLNAVSRTEKYCTKNKTRYKLSEKVDRRDGNKNIIIIEVGKHNVKSVSLEKVADAT